MMTPDTSALMAILLQEPTASACIRAIERETDFKISAGRVTESLIVAAGRGFANAMSELIEGLASEVLPVTMAAAGRVADAYRRWDRGFHPAALNFGDCFAYEVAAAHGGRLLFVGQDFAMTDLESVLPALNP